MRHSPIPSIVLPREDMRPSSDRCADRDG